MHQSFLMLSIISDYSFITFSLSWAAVFDLEMNHSMLANNNSFCCSREHVLSCWIFFAVYFIACGHSSMLIPQSDQYITLNNFFFCGKLLETVSGKMLLNSDVPFSELLPNLKSFWAQIMSVRRQKVDNFVHRFSERYFVS